MPPKRFQAPPAGHFQKSTWHFFRWLKTLQTTITFIFVHRHVSGRGNVTTIADWCVNLWDVFLKILCRERMDTFENPALIWSWEAFVVTVVNTTAFFFWEGVWRHGIFVSRWNLKERVTHVSRKSCIIQQIRWRLRSSWSVSTFIQSSVGWD